MPKETTPWTLQVRENGGFEISQSPTSDAIHPLPGGWRDEGTYPDLAAAKKAARAYLFKSPTATVRLAKIVGPITAERVERTRVVGL